LTSSANVGIFAVDPGKVTGLAWAIVPFKVKTVRQNMKERIGSGSAQISGSNEDQIRKIASMWREFRIICTEGLIDDELIEMVIEAWVVRPHMTGYGDVPVIPAQIGWGLYGYRLGRLDEWCETDAGPARPVRVVWQQPSAGKGTVKDDMLKEAGCWVRGQEHARDAWRHLYARVLTHAGGKA
jgi:hypothetical protein